MASNNLTSKILIAMSTGLVIGLILNSWITSPIVHEILVDAVFNTGGKIFIVIIKMIVVPVVLVSLICGTCHLSDMSQFGRMAIKTLGLYLLTTAIAITLGLVTANTLGIGTGDRMLSHLQFTPAPAPPLREVLLGIFPSNPFAALAQGNMLQVIFFAVLLGLAIAISGESGKRTAKFFQDLNEVIMSLIDMIMKIAPYGIFCLIASLFARLGFSLIYQLMGYFFTVVLVLLIHMVVSNAILLKLIARLNPITFFKKLFPAMLFAFSTSSSNASIPIVLETVEEKLGVDNKVASFVIPLGATINMDGTSIMQGVATVFIANTYGIHLGLVGYLTVILTATLASIGTAGIPGVGLITLSMVLKQVGLPVEGIVLIIGIDRLLDMLRTAVNITGDSAVACVIAKTEKALQVPGTPTATAQST